MEKKALINSRRLHFPKNDQTDKYFIAQREINLQSFNSTPANLKQRFKHLGKNRRWMPLSDGNNSVSNSASSSSNKLLGLKMN